MRVFSFSTLLSLRLVGAPLPTLRVDVFVSELLACSRLGFFRLLSDAPANPRAVGHPLDMTAFVSVPSTNLELLECLQLSANAVVRTLALQLYNTVGECLPPSAAAATAPASFWAEYPTTALLSLKGLYITDESCAPHPTHASRSTRPRFTQNTCSARTPLSVAMHELLLPST